MHLLTAIKKGFTGYFSYLLFSLILLFLFRPYERGTEYMSIWYIFFIGVFFASVYNCHHTPRIKFVVACLAIPAFIFHMLSFFLQQPIFIALSISCSLLFVGVVAISILNTVILHARVTLETLRGVICAYIMIGFAFAFAYYLVEFFVPGAIGFATDVQHSSFHHFISEVMYFSFVTLVGLGYGDIVPVHDAAQSVAIIEGITGQLYIAMLVARLVAVYSIRNVIKALRRD